MLIVNDNPQWWRPQRIYGNLQDQLLNKYMYTIMLYAQNQFLGNVIEKEKTDI